MEMFDTPAEYFDEGDINMGRVVSFLAYFPPLFLVPLIAVPSSKYARFHANQGLVMFLFLTAASVVATILSVLLGFIPYLGWIFGLFAWLFVGAAMLALTILGIVNVANNVAKELPFIGKFRLIK